MPQTIAIILPLLQDLASPTIAGIIAWGLFELLRRWFPQPAQRSTNELKQALYTLLYVPMLARLFVLAVAAVIGIGANALLAALTGAPILAAVDIALAATMSPLVSQIAHGLTLSTQLPDPYRTQKLEVPHG